ncbi:killer cell lectin-like receptor subfamily B member 1A isoform X2 [Adelges cooleyi]|uniref:killer cell lectin-like receptor subfamily B member 1A isoform X2 n=1 Tax=Adelges cooleyi TaxID=133065 RepID=UPI00218019C7|nr:killer cell lectin-like receptor subfamily B member 1A isoform X2 [Adelges cooleyi]
MDKTTLTVLFLFNTFILLYVSYSCESKLVYKCPSNFIRFGSECYYLGDTKLTWQEAYFECKYLTKGSKLSVLAKRWNDFNIRKFLKFKEKNEERWIGGIYDWGQYEWKWANSGRKISPNQLHMSIEFNDISNSHWQCTTLDPNIKSKWVAHSCLEKNFFICESKLQPECANDIQ